MAAVVLKGLPSGKQRSGSDFGRSTCWCLLAFDPSHRSSAQECRRACAREARASTSSSGLTARGARRARRAAAAAAARRRRRR
eukprot:5750940-Pleurochrysis_carterae.AAC.2